MTAPVAEVLACHFCGAVQPASGLIQPFAFGTPVARVVCKDGDACLARIDSGSLPERPVIATEPHPEPLVAGHQFVRPGQVAPDLAPPDACVVCGKPQASHSGGRWHRLQFLGLVATYDPDGGVTFGPFRVVCEDEPQVSVWARSFDAGHTTLDIERLVRQHNGVEDGAS